MALNEKLSFGIALNFYYLEVFYNRKKSKTRLHMVFKKFIIHKLFCKFQESLGLNRRSIENVNVSKSSLNLHPHPRRQKSKITRLQINHFLANSFAKLAKDHKIWIACSDHLKLHWSDLQINGKRCSIQLKLRIEQTSLNVFRLHPILPKHLNSVGRCAAIKITGIIRMFSFGKRYQSNCTISSLISSNALLIRW